MLLDKIDALNLPYDHKASRTARSNLSKQIDRLHHEEYLMEEQERELIDQGAAAFWDYIVEVYGPDTKPFEKLYKIVRCFYGRNGKHNVKTSFSYDGLPIKKEEFKKTVDEVEATAVEQAKQRLDTLNEEHKTLTISWAKATETMQKALKEEIERLEKEIAIWNPRTQPISQRLKALYDEDYARVLERRRLKKEWPSLESREKGGAIRRLFQKVTLFWNREFRPSKPNPTQPRKTNRPGRNKFTLEYDKIQWEFSDTDLISSS